MSLAPSATYTCRPAGINIRLLVFKRIKKKKIN